ncbi:hypothetical protein RGQ29_000792 [Quercus rubra]|uniref:DNA-directed RNA polymerases I and III subunit RPAC2 n=3 Tax=Fagaceae TaxID=3503 RepID=A0AAN7JDA3_QUERU|nr:hypothetical protein RGQ29_000792 [Quercus rubra]
MSDIYLTNRLTYSLSLPPRTLSSTISQWCCRELLTKMEHGSYADNSNATFSLTDEDHTLANAVRFSLNQDPRVSFSGYSIPHPSDNRVNIRVQTTGAPAREVLKDACQDLMMMCQHVRSTLDVAVADFKLRNPPKKDEDTDMK